MKLPAIATGYTSESFFFLFSHPPRLPSPPRLATRETPVPFPELANRGELPAYSRTGPSPASRGEQAGRRRPPPSLPLFPAPSLRLSSPPPPSIPQRRPVKDKTRRRSSSTLTLEKGKKSTSPSTGGRAKEKGSGYPHPHQRPTLPQPCKVSPFPSLCCVFF